jgi:hypothetical protein
MSKKALFVVVAFVVMPSTPSLGQTASSATESKVTSVNGADLYQARKVLKRFYASEPHPECYDVLFSSFEESLRVDFIPKRPPEITFDGKPEYVGPKSCGRNIGYVVDRNGNTLRKIYTK